MVTVEIVLPACLLLTIGLSYLANFWLSRVFLGRSYRYFLAPGIILHEYAHAIGCVLTGTRIRRIQLFDATGGRVVHEKPPLLAQAVISLAPIILAQLAIYLAARAFVPELLRGELPGWHLGTVVFGYLAAVIAVTMVPSRQDLRVGGLSLLAWFVILATVAVSPLARDYLGFVLGDTFEGLEYLALFTISVLLAITLGAGVSFGIVHRHRPSGTRYRPIE